jgi:SAM-dependent MidA family methyltransferase
MGPEATGASDVGCRRGDNGRVLPHWETTIQPLLTALGSGPIVEVGAGRGERAGDLLALIQISEPTRQEAIADY